MGISLPRKFIKLFPDDNKQHLQLSTNCSGLALTNEDSGTQSEQNLSPTYLSNLLDRRSSSYRLLRHNRKACLLCYRSERTPTQEDDQNEQQKVKLDVLRHVERLANPVWTKQSKQALLHLKQRHYSNFQDVCLYSEVCNLMNSTGYRLSARRFLQELFLDLNFNELLAEHNQALKERIFTEKRLSPIPKEDVPTDGTVVFVTASDSNRNVIKGFEIQSSPEKEYVHKRSVDITDLKLTCSENKFPIKHSQVNFVPASVKSSVKSPDSFKSFMFLGNSLDSARRTLSEDDPTQKPATQTDKT